MKRQAELQTTYRCMSCPWAGAKSDCVQKVHGGSLHHFCPRCYHPCRAAGTRLAHKPAKPVPIQGKPPREETLERVRTCKRCGFTAPGREFPIACQRGRQTVRSWCHECTLAYYRSRYAARAAVKKAKVGA